MKQLAEKVSQNKNFNVELIDLVEKLHTQLVESKGKKVYGYLKSDVKKTVDAIFMRLADNESVKKMYDLWCEIEQQKHDVYSSAKIDFPNLIDNKEFRSVKNMIIQTVMEMEYPIAKMTNLSEIADEFVLNSKQHFNGTVQTENVSEIPQQSVNLITENEILANTIFGLFVNLSRCIEDDYQRKFKSGRKMIDSKLRRMIQEKNQALGIRQEHGHTLEY